jgi:hypothetical protein
MKLPKPNKTQQPLRYPIEGSGIDRFEDDTLPIPIVYDNILIDQIDDYFKNEVIDPLDRAASESEEYWGSEYQKNKYEQLKIKDKTFERLIIRKYGSFSNFETVARLGDDMNVFDPFTDYKFDVTIITKNKFYKTDHISTYELIREALYGVCSVEYKKVNGQPDKLIGTLYKPYVPSSRTEERYNFYFPQAGNRVVLWDMIKGDWSSFYMKNVMRFVRDDSTGLE